MPAAHSRLRANALILVVISTLYQGLALLGLIDVTAGKAQRLGFGLGEMLLILALLGNAWLILRALRGADPMVAGCARLMFASLALCCLGDLVNRNVGGRLFAYDELIAHSYLADSVWFFLPGYGLYLLASLRVARDAGLSARFLGLVTAGAALLGALSFADLYRPGVAAYVLAMTGTYAVFITVVGASAIWLVRALGWAQAWPVAIGAVLALLADALIGHFWLYRDGFFPAISHLNWIIYFGSQALLQQLPLQLEAARDTGA